jgi:hypothetical protein
MKPSKILFIVFICIFIISCATGSYSKKPMPEWLEKGLDTPRWEEDDHIFFLGHAVLDYDNPEVLKTNAAMQARRRISEELLLTIESEFIGETAGSLDDVSTTFREQVRVESEALIYGSSIVATYLYRDKDIYACYTLVKLLKTDYQKMITTMEQTWGQKLIQAHNLTLELENGKGTLSAGRSLDIYMEIRSLLQDCILSEYEGIRKNDVIADTENLRNILLNRITVQKISGDNQRAVLGSPVPEPIILQYSFGDIPGTAINIHTEWIQGNGLIMAERQTDADGVFAVQLTKCLTLGINKVGIGIDYPVEGMNSLSQEISLTVDPIEENIFGVFIYSYATLNGEDFILDNYLEKQMQQLVSSRFGYEISSETSKNPEAADLIHSIMHEGNSDSIFSLGSIALSRFLIIGQSSVSIEQDDKDLYSAVEPEVNIIVFDLFENKVIGKTKASYSRKIISKDKVACAEGAIENLRPELSRWFVKNVLEEITP